ncbi:uncharacterized protein Z519_12071 [Cladophialophora bantiana CBS 173.52]|uniref:RING-type domain-containing protein n=1 Tax=Cladophialophora bantiana (strain ATCC 10958 / CBS 173.52 / CDC B-1940 / NIH 8579) TaxID=1442370 RepID=A0A0D2H975_CLAB1|nr:uncharacterized protein Z519_12071 [Cladophialophora bantiana CBS 173.52]KIW87435.1 hypothetical protein Z519_12071 [Cladophialophora bantiana CBS 173.52]
MSAQDFGVVAIVLPNPQYDPSNGARIVNESFGFALRASGLIRTLSPSNPHHYDVIQGLLYSPALPPSSPCGNSTRSLIPANATTRDQLPPGDYPLIALAPWTEPECVISYLSAMRSDQVRGAIFFQPGNSNEQPPPVSDRSWTLHDGGQWKSTNDYPVYAIPGMLGSFLLNELALYSGNMSEVPFGSELVQIYNPNDTIRLYARMDVASTTGIPSLWVFLIIVLAILLAVVLMTSIVMHMIQRRQRRVLQRRVANGEVDLEALGIKRLQVPQELLDKMPKYTYNTKMESDGVNGDSSNEAVEPETVDAPKPEVEKSAQVDAKDFESAIAPAVVVHPVAFSQSTCPICLDDFVSGETTVRELPCNHIFHPECIDPFLRDNSSLCPLCKKSSLPPGYCPVQVTNLMVRRERLMRRMRQRSSAAEESSMASHMHRLPAPILAITGRSVRSISIPMVSPQIPVDQARSGVAGMEDGPLARRQNTVEDEIPADIRAQGVSARRAWLRERLARREARSYEQRVDEGRAAEESRPLWRRIAGRLFPSL